MHGVGDPLLRKGEEMWVAGLKSAGHYDWPLGPGTLTKDQPWSGCHFAGVEWERSPLYSLAVTNGMAW